MELINRDVARADRSLGYAVKRYPSLSDAQPKHGYWFSQIPRYQKGPEEHPYDDGTGQNADHFGLVTYPSQYEGPGTLTYIVNEKNVIYRKDTAGRPVLVFPEDPIAEGWSTLD